jgi:hypothetical protein
MTYAPSTGSELILYRTEDGRTRMECRLEVSGTHAEHTVLEVG